MQCSRAAAMEAAISSRRTDETPDQASSCSDIKLSAPTQRPSVRSGTTATDSMPHCQPLIANRKTLSNALAAIHNERAPVLDHPARDRAGASDGLALVELQAHL